MSILSEMAPPTRSSRPTGGQRARVVKPPTALDASLTVSLLSYSNDYEYEVPATNWISRGTALPIAGAVGVAVFDDHGDAWFLLGGGTEFPAGGGGGGTETDPVASAALTAHAADTTAIHGIADTSLLVVTSDTRLTNARTPTAHHTTHEPGGTDAMAVDAAAATGSLRTLGTGATQAAPGNDARLSDQRVPTDGSVTNAKVAATAAIARAKLDFGSGLVNADIAAAAGIAKSKLAALTIVNADVDVAAAIAESKLTLASDAAAGTASRRTLGTGATQAAAGNDARFTDARTPTAHKTSHASGGSDALTGDLDAVGRTNVKKAGTTIGTRRGLNLIEGANVTLTVADDAANEEVDVTIAAAAGGGSSAATGAFSAYRSTAASYATAAVVVFNTELFDVSGWFNNTTGIYTPLTAGYYRLSAGVYSNTALTADNYWQIRLQKNGADLHGGSMAVQRGVQTPLSVGSWLVQANGTTDNFKIAILHNQGVAVAVVATTVGAYFQGELVGT